MVLIQHLKPEVIEVVRKLIIEDDRLRAYMDIYNAELNKSLEVETDDEAAVKSYVTYVNKLPTGQERGNFLALEFGGPTLKIMLMTLHENKYDMKIQPVEIPEYLMIGKSKKLFDFIAKCLSIFLKIWPLRIPRIPLGIVFGFPIEQINLQDCKLLRWSKGFQCNDLVGENIFPKLKESFRRYENLKGIYIIGILNETVSMMLSSTLDSPDCKIAMVIGYVTNCCYMEKISRVKKYEPKTFGEKLMCINIETGCLGDDGCLNDFRTDFDIQMDQESQTPGTLTTEKMTSLPYLGEIVRLALIRCIEKNAILDGKVTDQLLQKFAFEFTHMMRIESDPEHDHTNCRDVLVEFGYSDVSDEDCTQIQFICRCVSRRTANLMAAQLAALMIKINEPIITIALDGEMLRNYPRFEWYLLRKLNQLKKEEHSFRIIKLNSESLIKGGAVLASIFGEEIMNRDEKLRRLPGFPVNRCHFRKTGRCLNPDCNARHPCDKANVNPMQKPIQPEEKDLELPCFDQSHCKKKECKGYDQL